MTATLARLRTNLALQMALDSKRRAARVTELRERAHLTQRALEDRSGVSERTIQRAEDPDDPIELRYSTREKLAKALRVKPEDLLAEAEGDKPTATPDLSAALNGNGPHEDSEEVTQLRAEVAELKGLLENLGTAIEGISTQIEATSEQFETRHAELKRALGRAGRRVA